MRDFPHQQLQELQDQVHALQQLLLAQLVVIDGADRLAGVGAIAVAVSQLPALRAFRPGAARRLDGMIKAVEQCRD